MAEVHQIFEGLLGSPANALHYHLARNFNIEQRN